MLWKELSCWCCTTSVFFSLALPFHDKNWRWMEQKILQDNLNKINNNINNNDNKDCNDDEDGSSSSSSTFVLIDVENVRGKTGFAMNHIDALQKTSRWAITNNLDGCVSMVVDHGSIPSGYYMDDLALGVVFAGPNCKADDVIARDVSSTLSLNHHNNNNNNYNNDNNVLVVVVTSDNGLIQRCRYSSSKQKHALHIWSPLRFLDDLNYLEEQYETNNNNHNDTISTICHEIDDRTTCMSLEQNENEDGHVNIDSFLNEMSADIQLVASLLDQEKIILDKNKANTKSKNNNNSSSSSSGKNKQLRKLRKRIVQIRTKIGRKYAASSYLVRADSISFTGKKLRDKNVSNEQQILYDQWHDIMFRNLHSSGHQYKEQTKDRVILAERLRQQIEHYTISNSNKKDQSNDSFNNMRIGWPKDARTDARRNRDGRHDRQI